MTLFLPLIPLQRWLCWLVSVQLMILSATTAVGEENAKVLRLASTTTIVDSGLLAHIAPFFEADTGYQLLNFSVGSGRALRMGRSGAVDLVWVSSPEAEALFLKDGHGLVQRAIMYNYFCLLGPENDPASIATLPSSVEAMKRIARNQMLFVSRGDDSGTHTRERQLWKLAAIDVIGQSFYYETGQGMAETLKTASQLGGYTLSDQGSWLIHAETLKLREYYCNEPELHNLYSIITINPNHHLNIDRFGADQLSRWLISDRGRSVINGLRVGSRNLFSTVTGTKE